MLAERAKGAERNVCGEDCPDCHPPAGSAEYDPASLGRFERENAEVERGQAPDPTGRSCADTVAAQPAPKRPTTPPVMYAAISTRCRLACATCRPATMESTTTRGYRPARRSGARPSRTAAPAGSSSAQTAPTATCAGALQRAWFLSETPVGKICSAVSRRDMKASTATARCLGVRRPCVEQGRSTTVRASSVIGPRST